MVDELLTTAPFIDQRYSDRGSPLPFGLALTDAELFISITCPRRLWGRCSPALPQAPRSARQSGDLTLCTPRASRFTEAAVCLPDFGKHLPRLDIRKRLLVMANSRPNRERRGSAVPELSCQRQCVEPKFAVPDASQFADAAPEPPIAEIALTEAAVGAAAGAGFPVAAVSAPAAEGTRTPGLRFSLRLRQKRITPNFAESVGAEGNRYIRGVGRFDFR